MIFTVPSSWMKMFAGLMSRWTMPAWCACDEPGEHLHDHHHLALEGERRRLAHRLLEVLALQELHRDVGRAVRVVAEVEHRSPRSGASSWRRPSPRARSAALSSGSSAICGDHDLERHVALEHRVVGQVDQAHRALAEGTLDLVLADAARELPCDRLRWIAGLGASFGDVSGATTRKPLGARHPLVSGLLASCRSP